MASGQRKNELGYYILRVQATRYSFKDRGHESSNKIMVTVKITDSRVTGHKNLNHMQAMGLHHS